MPVETVTGIQDLNPSWPTSVDPVSEGDDHCRLTKQAIQQSFPGMSAAWRTSSEISGTGYDANLGRVRNVGVPVDPLDALRKGDGDALDARLQALEAQAATFTSFGIFDGVNNNILGGSGDFSVIKNGSGDYTITFTEAATGLHSQSCVATLYAQSPFIAERTINTFMLSTTQVQVQIIDDAGQPSLEDQVFSFIRMAD